MKQKMGGLVRLDHHSAGEKDAGGDPLSRKLLSRRDSAPPYGRFQGWLLAHDFLLGRVLLGLPFLFATLLVTLLPLTIRGPSLPLKGLHAQQRSNAAGDALIYHLCGPNDGEPINGRTVRLKLLTNYEERSSISVHVNHVFLYSLPLDPNSRSDDATGLLTANIDFDIERALRSSGDSPTITVTVYLYSDLTSRLVAYREWEGNLGRPWIEFLPKNTGNRSQGTPPPGAPAPATGPAGFTAMAIRPLQNDSYFLLFASTQKETLSLSPDDPEVFRKARLVGSGSCFPYGTESHVKNVVYLDTSLESSTQQVFVVLWTYDTDGGWKRSSITSVPRP
jgi:hypothetical protein